VKWGLICLYFLHRHLMDRFSSLGNSEELCIWHKSLVTYFSFIYHVSGKLLNFCTQSTRYQGDGLYEFE
jgi:hypothetical protein